MATCSVIEKLEWLQTYKTAFILNWEKDEFWRKLEVYLRSSGFSVGNKLCFCACICLSFFNAIIGLSCNCFSLGMPEYVTYKYRAENGICYVMWRPFSGVRWGEVVPYITGYYFNTYYYTQLLIWNWCSFQIWATQRLFVKSTVLIFLYGNLLLNSTRVAFTVFQLIFSIKHI